MTVSDWGSASVPYGAPGYTQGRTRAMDLQAIHPAHGGPDPRQTSQMNTQGGYAPVPGDPAQPGYSHPPAYGSAPAYGHHPDRAAAPRGAGVLNVIGALVSVALVVGLGVWGYKLAVRDVTGVPVVKALEGPMRIQPEDPGGAVAPHQGLAVNDIAAEGPSAGPVDQLVLAPPAAALTAEDVPAHPEAEVSAAPGRPSVLPLPSSGGEIDADAAVAEALGLSDIPGLDLPGSAGPASDAPGLDIPVSASPVEVIPESVPGVVRSPRPMPRPATFSDLPEITEPVRAVDVVASADTPAPARPVAAATSATASAPEVVLGNEVAPDAVDASARLVQLGAYPSVDEARDRWKVIAALNPELFRNRNWTIEKGESGGAPFYRLRAIGFDGLQDARAFCAALIAAQGSCVPVID